MNCNGRWDLDGEDFIRAETLEPLFMDKPVISIIEDLNQKAYQRFKSDSYYTKNAILLHTQEGLSCQILKYGSKNWISGKIRYVLEFEPDDPSEMLEVQASIQDEGSTVSLEMEEPLDQIRQLGEE
ncbi:MAG: hypothetical protein EAZ61_06670 [Oscillatoriales cyanobacterium]|nr:MAG: hypothetical protein EAZ61_06670 [Oscillatoriales cyanobacterium]